MEMNIRPVICFSVASVLLLIVMANTTLAQQARSTSPDPKSEQRERQQREANLRTAEAVVALEKKDQQRIAAAVKQIKDDFKRIQILRNHMVRNLIANKPLDYKSISDETGEISACAGRLKTFLLPPVPQDKTNENNQKKDLDFNHEELKEALVRLCNLIAGFIDNPVLKNPGEKVDVELSTRAGSDLTTIIDLSGKIKKSAEKLKCHSC
jgi:hypothetical protein